MRLAASSATRTSSASSGDTGTQSPAFAATQWISASGRNRLQAELDVAADLLGDPARGRDERGVGHDDPRRRAPQWPLRGVRPDRQPLQQGHQEPPGRGRARVAARAAAEIGAARRARGRASSSSPRRAGPTSYSSCCWRPRSRCSPRGPRRRPPTVPPTLRTSMVPVATASRRLPASLPMGAFMGQPSAARPVRAAGRPCALPVGLPGDPCPALSSTAGSQEAHRFRLAPAQAPTRQ